VQSLFTRMHGLTVTAFIVVRFCLACAFITPLLAVLITMQKGKSLMPYF
jgi:hypothetical protein